MDALALVGHFQKAPGIAPPLRMLAPYFFWVTLTLTHRISTPWTRSPYKLSAGSKTRLELWRQRPQCVLAAANPGGFLRTRVGF